MPITHAVDMPHQQEGHQQLMMNCSWLLISYAAYLYIKPQLGPRSMLVGSACSSLSIYTELLTSSYLGPHLFQARHRSGLLRKALSYTLICSFSALGLYHSWLIPSRTKILIFLDGRWVALQIGRVSNFWSSYGKFDPVHTRIPRITDNQNTTKEDEIVET